MEKRLKALLRLAIRKQATDIHFTQRHFEMEIEMRIHDQMYKVKTEQQDVKLFRYLQYLSGLDVGNLLTPQTGQFEMEIDGEILSLRYALISTLHFSNGVLRILNRKIKIDPCALSIFPWQNKCLQDALKRKNGLILFSGPTGSGKTTTLYSLLKSVRQKKIFTMEDPIEVYSEQYVQLQVNETIGFDYGEGIKQILRHDPDIIMIGEIRDEKAAKMAVRAANTGHLVLSSIHASSASLSIQRMVELGVDEKQLSEVLLLLSHQRMVYEKKNQKRLVLYEMMDEKEILYHREHKKHSDGFLNIETQMRWLVEKGILDETILLQK